MGAGRGRPPTARARSIATPAPTTGRCTTACCRWNLAATFTLALVAGATASTPGRGVISSGKLPCLSHAPTTAPHESTTHTRWIGVRGGGDRDLLRRPCLLHTLLCSLAIAMKQTSSKPSPFSLLLLSIEQATNTSSNPKL
ncbi:unnamed protein product [Urochloa humidicola]